MAEFYKGFVFERDVSAPLAIEGNPVRVEPGPGGKRFTVKLPAGEPIDAGVIKTGTRIPTERLCERELHTTGFSRVVLEPLPNRITGGHKIPSASAAW